MFRKPVLTQPLWHKAYVAIKISDKNKIPLTHRKSLYFL